MQIKTDSEFYKFTISSGTDAKNDYEIRDTSTTSCIYVKTGDYESSMLKSQNEKLETEILMLRQQIKNLKKEKEIKQMCQETLLDSLNKIQKIDTGDSEILIIGIPINLIEHTNIIKKEFERILNSIQNSKLSIVITGCEFEYSKIKKNDLLKYGLKKVMAVQLIDI